MPSADSIRALQRQRLECGCGDCLQSVRNAQDRCFHEFDRMADRDARECRLCLYQISEADLRNTGLYQGRLETQVPQARRKIDVLPAEFVELWGEIGQAFKAAVQCEEYTPKKWPNRTLKAAKDVVTRTSDCEPRRGIRGMRFDGTYIDESSSFAFVGPPPEVLQAIPPAYPEPPAFRYRLASMPSPSILAQIRTLDDDTPF